MGIRSTLFMSMKKRVDGEPKIAASAAFAVDPILKHIFIVDDDIDVFDNDQVLWAMTTRFQADRDLIVMPNFLGGHLNPVTYGYHREEKGPDGDQDDPRLHQAGAAGHLPARVRGAPDVVEKVDPGALLKPVSSTGSLFNEPMG